MTSDALPTPASAERLTDALRRAGALDKASVRAVVVEKTRNTILSRIYFLRLEYDGVTDAPTGLFLKTAHPDRQNASHGGRQEVAFYSSVASTTPPDLLARCFDAHWDPESGVWHLLLENLDQ